MILTSRSAVVTRKTCAMKRYWAYHATHPEMPEAGAVGLSPRQGGNQIATDRGSLIHAMLEVGIGGGCVDTVAPPEGMPLEQVVLCRRAAKGWLQHRAPQVLRDYQPVSAEQEWQWALSPFVTQQLRLDQVMRHRSTGHLLILDYKTVSRPDLHWVDRLRDSDQTHLYIQALTERTQEFGVHMQYEGIVVGTFDKGVQKSLFVSHYQTAEGLPTSHYTPRAPRYASLHWSDEEWLAWAQEQGVLHDLYMTTGPIYPMTESLLATKNATAHAELQWANTLAQVDAAADDEARAFARERLIERNPDACLKYGRAYACPYLGLCWEGHAIDTDSFYPRIDHHKPEGELA